MPVRINLKELFGSDSQTITVDKLNFNFNKLLELGIGLEGVKGVTGGTGSIGPSGIKGDQGDKGNQWFVGTSDPNATTFPGLMDEDFYVLSDNSQIWQYDELTNTWNIIVDLGGIVNNYLNTAGTTFVRGFGEGSPQDSRYIMFPNRGNSITDQQGDKIGAGVTDNDILMLSNFNETLQGLVLDIDNDLSDTDKYYTAIQKIYVDRSNSIDKRYHLELGSLNDVGSTGSPFELSTLNQNLKLRHEYKNGIFNGVFSLTKLESAPIGGILHNGLFDFQFAKFNASGPTVQREGFVQMGSRYSHLAMGRSYVEFDGINFNVSGVGNGGIGIGENFNNVLPHINGNSYLVLKTDDTGVNGIMLDTDVYQDNGNIEQLGTGPVSVNTAIGSGIANSALGNLTYGLNGIAISGNRVIQAGGSTSIAYPATNLNDAGFEGYMFVSDINNSNSPINVSSQLFTGKSADISGIIPVGAAISDIAVNGELLYLITNQQSGVQNDITVGSNVYNRTNFQIVRFDTDVASDFTSVFQTRITSLDGAHRIKLNGGRAIVATNHLRSWGNPAENAINSQYEHDGYITSVNITNEQTPIVVASKNTDRMHHLDLEVANNKAYTISIEFNPPVGVNHPGFGVSVRSFDLDNAIGTESSYNIVAPNTVNINNANHNNLTSINKFGAIAVSGDIIWAVHKNILYTLKQDSVSGSFTPLNILAYNIDDNIRAMDIEVVGESIYVLCASGNPTMAYSPTNTHIVKINKREVSSPVIISKTDINEPSSSRLIIEGNNIYVNKTNGNTGYLIPIEIDGFKSDAIKIGSIKSTCANITNDLKVGNNLNVGQSVNVGKGGIKAIGPIASGIVLTNLSGINKTITELNLNPFSLQVSGNMLMHNTHVTGTTKLHFNSTASSRKTEVINLSPNGSLMFKATPNYITENNPADLATLSIIGGGTNGIYMYTPDSTTVDLVGDIKIRPGDTTIPLDFPIAGQPPYYKEGVIVLERRVQMVNSLEIGIGGNFANTFNLGTLWMRRTESSGNWASGTYNTNIAQLSKPYDRIIRFQASGVGGTPPGKLMVWMENTPGSGSMTIAGLTGGWHLTKKMMFDPDMVEQIIIPSCHRFYIEVGLGISNGWTNNFKISQYRFGKLDGGCNGAGNVSINEDAAIVAPEVSINEDAAIVAPE